ncbi:hypothetical protein C2G38_2155006 [Gigaspora rosea]|uniref:Uncharacterized protein n=1 Tax=Gigaspora rosea TaxID=44941 RepID=A0A397W4B0_9GLOM|nr:hypothetical protein C2G38_2155006 [Gigaspora rosea]
MNYIEENNSNNKENYCSRCDNFHSPESFITNKKTYRTCNKCRTQNKIYKQVKNNEQSPDNLIEIHDLSDVISQEFESVENSIDNAEDKKNRNDVEFTFSCSININELEGNSKEKASKIIEIISDVDEYKWIDCMIEKPKKYSDYSKHRDKLSMIHFSCEGHIKITIYQDLLISDINMRYKLHSIRQDVSISNEIKDFIANNIDLLPREIYKRLIDHNLSINIRQKQIYYWWNELGKSQYKRDNDAFFSAQKWLNEKSYEIIFQSESPKALGFLTKIWNTVQDLRLKIQEIGVDSTYKEIYLFI